MPHTFTKIALKSRAAGALALAACMLACGGEEKAEKPRERAALPPVESAGTAQATPAPTIAPAHNYGAMKQVSDNVIPDPGFRNLKEQWSLTVIPRTAKYTATREEVELPNGKSVAALKITTDENVELTLQHPIIAKPTARYEFSVWVKQTPSPVGNRFFGPLLFDQSANPIAAFTSNGIKQSVKRHFITFNYQDSLWRQFTGTLLPSEAVPADFTESKVEGRGLTLRSPQELRGVGMFFLNYYNKGRKVTTWVAAPAIAEYE